MHQGKSNSVEDTHPHILAHPGFPKWWNVRRQFREVFSDHLRNAVFRSGTGMVEDLQHLAPGDPIDRDTASRGVLARSLYEVPDSRAASGASVRRIFYNDHVRTVVFEKDADLAQSASAIGMTYVSRSPVDQRCRPFEHGKTEPAARGVDRKHSMVFPPLQSHRRRGQ